MRPISVTIDSVGFSLPSEYHFIMESADAAGTYRKRIQQNVMVWLSTGSYDSQITTVLDDGASSTYDDKSFWKMTF